MLVNSIKIQNYASLYGEHVFHFENRGLTAVLGDNQDEPRMNSNGAGKSNIFGALDWGLFGEVPKGDHVDSVVNDDAEQCAVTVYLQDETIPLVVRRSKARGRSAGLEFWVDGTLVQALDLKETQRQLERHLGLDREVFHATVLYGQEDLFHFADSTSDAKRMELLSKVLQLSEIETWLEQVKVRVKETETEISGLELQKIRLSDRLEIKQQQSAEFDAHISEWENQRAEKLRAGMQQLADFNANIERAKKVVAQKESVQGVLSVLDPMGATVIDWSNFDQQIAGARSVQSQRQSQLGGIKATIAARRQQLKRLADLGVGACPECGQPLSVQHLATERERLNAELVTLGQQEQQMLTGVAQAGEAVCAAENAKEQARAQHLAGERDLAERRAEAKKQLDEIMQAEQYLVQAEQHATYLHEELAKSRNLTNPWIEKKKLANAEVTQTHGALKLADAELARTAETLLYLNFWKNAFGPKGLKSYVLDARLQEMTDAANEWVKLLTGGTFWVRFETQKLGRSTKKLTNQITLRVFCYRRDGRVLERNYRSYSGGQKKRISWAVDFGLSRLIAARASKSWDLLILDEVFKHVDVSGGEAVVEMLQRLRHEKSSIFVVEHNADFVAHFENHITVRLKNGRSAIVGAEHETQSQRAPKRKNIPNRKPVRARVSPT